MKEEVMKEVCSVLEKIKELSTCLAQEEGSNDDPIVDQLIQQFKDLNRNGIELTINHLKAGQHKPIKKEKGEVIKEEVKKKNIRNGVLVQPSVSKGEYEVCSVKNELVEVTEEWGKMCYLEANYTNRPLRIPIVVSEELKIKIMDAQLKTNGLSFLVDIALTKSGKNKLIIKDFFFPEELMEGGPNLIFTAKEGIGRGEFSVFCDSEKLNFGLMDGYVLEETDFLIIKSAANFSRRSVTSHYVTGCFNGVSFKRIPLTDELMDNALSIYPRLHSLMKSNGII